MAVVGQLLDYGADRGQVDLQGQQAIDLARSQGRTELYELLAPSVAGYHRVASFSSQVGATFVSQASQEFTSQMFLPPASQLKRSISALPALNDAKRIRLAQEEDWGLARDDLELGKFLGRGASARVRAALWQGITPVALKVPRYPLSAAGSSGLRAVATPPERVALSQSTETPEHCWLLWWPVHLCCP